MSRLKQRHTGKILIIGILLLPFIAYSTLFITDYLKLYNNDWITNHAHIKYCGGAFGLGNALFSCGSASDCLIKDNKIDVLAPYQDQLQTVEIIKRELRLDLVPILHVRHNRGVTKYCIK